MAVTPNNPGQKTVLIVEDHAVMRSILDRFVQDAFPGISILQAAGAAQAQKLFALHQPQLVLMDISLPDANGIKLAARLKAQQPDLKVIIVSSFDGRDHIEHARAIDVTAYVTKDKIHQELLPHVAGALGLAMPPGAAGTTVSP